MEYIDTYSKIKPICQQLFALMVPCVSPCVFSNSFDCCSSSAMDLNIPPEPVAFNNSSRSCCYAVSAIYAAQNKLHPQSTIPIPTKRGHKHRGYSSRSFSSRIYFFQMSPADTDRDWNWNRTELINSNLIIPVPYRTTLLAFTLWIQTNSIRSQN